MSIVPALFLIFGPLVIWLLWKSSPLIVLPKAYAHPDSFNGPCYETKAMIDGFDQYYGNFRLGANLEGLYIQKEKSVKENMEPVFIPWNEIIFSEGNLMFSPCIRFKFLPKRTGLKVPEAVARALLRDAQKRPC